MILSNLEIQKALDEKRLVISPEPSPRQPTGNATDDCPYQTSSVDLRLAPEISYFKEGLPLDINLSRGGFAQLFGPIICNSELDPEDITTAAAAQAAMRRSWCSGRPEDAPAFGFGHSQFFC